MQIIIIILLVVIAGLVVFLLVRPQKKTEDSQVSSLLLQQLNELTKRQEELKESVQDKLGQSARDMNESMKHQSSESIKIIRDVTERLTQLDETNDKPEKERLEKLFVNDLKNRITETAKYIQPDQNTMEFAFMFIPHEAIYYDLLINKIGAVTTEDTENLIQRAASKYKVIIVSPTSFLAYLQTVLQGLKAMQIEDSAKDILKRVGELGNHLQKYDTFMQKLGSSLGTTVNHFNTAHKELKKVDKDVMRITVSAIEI